MKKKRRVKRLSGPFYKRGHRSTTKWRRMVGHRAEEMLQDWTDQLRRRYAVHSPPGEET